VAACPYCGTAQRDRPASPETDVASTMRFSIGVVGACVLLYLAALLLDSRASGEAPSITDGPSYETWQRIAAVEAPAVYERGEWWRIVSSMFVHFGIIHLALNLAWIVYLTPLCASTFRFHRTVAVYLFGGVGGSFGWLLVQGREPGIAGGASGAVCALVGGLLAYSLRRKGPDGRLLRERMTRDTLFIVIWSLAVAKLAQNSVGHAAHAGGWIAGFAIGWFAGNHVPEGGRADRFWRRCAWAGVALLVVAAAFVERAAASPA